MSSELETLKIELEAMREANEFLRVDILKTVAMFQESEKDRWTARKENAELKEKLARAEKQITFITAQMKSAEKTAEHRFEINAALRTRIEAFRSFFNKYCICKTAEPYAVCLPCKMLEEDDALEKKDDTLP